MGTSAGDRQGVWDEAQAAELFRRGEKLIQQQHTDRAIRAFENYLRRQDPDINRHHRGLMLLATAYRDQGQLDRACAITLSLLDATEDPEIEDWAVPFLDTVTPPPEEEKAESATEASDPKAIEESDLQASFQPQPLESFRVFARQELAPYLVNLERERKATLRNILISSVIVIAAVVLILYVGLYLVSTFSELSMESPSSRPAVPSLEVISGTATPTPSPEPTQSQPLEPEGRDLSFESISVWLVTLFLGMSTWVFFYSVFFDLYGRDFKSKVIGKIIKFIDPDKRFSYSPRIIFSDTPAALEASTLFGHSIYRVHEDDCVSGKLGKTSVFFSEVLAEDPPRDRGLGRLLINRSYGTHNSKYIFHIIVIISFVKLVFGLPFVLKCVTQGRKLDFTDFWQGTAFRRTRFKGLFFRANFNKSFKQRTVVLPEGNFADDVTRRVTALSQPHGQAIKLEDPQFRQLFRVYGEDQVEARYLLSTSLMDRLVTLRKKLNRPVWVAFVGNQIYLAIRYREDLFEPKLFSRMNRLAPCQEYFETFQTMLQIVDDLNLNRRIWA